MRELTKMLSFVEKIRQAAPHNGDPWQLPLERLHGKIGDDGIERTIRRSCLTSLRSLSAVEEPGVPPSGETDGRARWTAVRVRGLYPGWVSGAGPWLLPRASATDPLILI